jgi:hypothetical protein
VLFGKAQSGMVFAVRMIEKAKDHTICPANSSYENPLVGPIAQADIRGFQTIRF